MLDTVKSNLPKIAVGTAGALVAMAAVGSKSTLVKIGGAFAIMAIATVIATKIG